MTRTAEINQLLVASLNRPRHQVQSWKQTLRPAELFLGAAGMEPLVAMATYPIFFWTFLECFLTGLVGGDGEERHAASLKHKRPPQSSAQRPLQDRPGSGNVPSVCPPEGRTTVPFHFSGLFVASQR